jgi:hypothetical protein
LSHEVAPFDLRTHGNGDAGTAMDKTMAAHSKKSRLIIYGNTTEQEHHITNNIQESQVRDYQKKEDTIDNFLKDFYE